jgi:DNA end-binding protein Ku
MAARPHWKAYLKLSLVSCRIVLYSASSSGERVSFRQINRKTGNRLRQQLVDDVTREPVESEDKARGYEYDKGSFLLIEDEELEAIAVESTHTIEIDKFVPRAQIDERYFDSPYYITPNDKVGQDAFAVIREAMRGKKMVALARVVLSKRERVVMLQPWDKGIMATTLHYPYELREAKDYFDDLPDIKVPSDMLKLAEHILESKAADFEPSEFVDHYEEAVVDMLKYKQAGQPAPKERPSAASPNVINLMDALRRSIDAERKPAVRPKAKKTADGQREMLLPITGGGKEKQKVAAPRPAKQRKAS